MTNDRMGTGPSSWDCTPSCSFATYALSADAFSESLDAAGIEVDTRARPVFLNDVPALQSIGVRPYQGGQR